MTDQAKGEAKSPPTARMLSFREFTEAKKAGRVPTKRPMKARTKPGRSRLAKTVIRTLREAVIRRASVRT